MIFTQPIDLFIISMTYCLQECKIILYECYKGWQMSQGSFLTLQNDIS